MKLVFYAILILPLVSCYHLTPSPESIDCYSSTKEIYASQGYITRENQEYLIDDILTHKKTETNANCLITEI